MFCIGSIISAVDECKVRGFTQAKIVEVLLKSIDEECEEFDNETASNLARGVKNPSIYVMDALTKITPDAYGRISVYFRDNVVSLIKENEKKLVRDALVALILDTSEIEEDTVVEIINGIKKSDLSEKKDDLAPFLAGLFLYALKNTRNNVGGKAKATIKKYLDKVRNDVRTDKNMLSDKGEAETESDGTIHEKRSRELELMEERIESDAVAFCMKYEKEKDLIPLCQVAFITNPTKKHAREMYNEFCLYTASTRKRILEMNDIDIIDVSEKDWWWKYLNMFKKDYEKYKLGDIQYQYVFGQYFQRLINYGDESIKRFLQRVIPPKIIPPYMIKLSDCYHDIIFFIDEYIYYGKFEKYKDILEPPMNFLWREFSLYDSKKCSEFMLASVLALFIIGTCLKTPLENGTDECFITFNAPGVSELETAEDLFYNTLLMLYENYEKVGLKSF